MRPCSPRRNRGTSTGGRASHEEDEQDRQSAADQGCGFEAAFSPGWVPVRREVVRDLILSDDRVAQHFPTSRAAPADLDSCSARHRLPRAPVGLPGREASDIASLPGRATGLSGGRPIAVWCGASQGPNPWPCPNRGARCSSDNLETGCPCGCWDNRGLFCALPRLVRDAARRRGQPGPAPLADNDAVDRRFADAEPLSDLRPPDAGTFEPQDVFHRTAGVRLAACPEARGHSGRSGEPGLDAIRPLEDAIRPTALLA